MGIRTKRLTMKKTLVNDERKVVELERGERWSNANDQLLEGNRCPNFHHPHSL